MRNHMASRTFVVRAGLGILVLALLGLYLESKASALDGQDQG
jgi:hypothetical protein